jgi:hypothetical protein
MFTSFDAQFKFTQALPIFFLCIDNLLLLNTGLKFA